MPDAIEAPGTSPILRRAEAFAAFAIADPHTSVADDAAALLMAGMKLAIVSGRNLDDMVRLLTATYNATMQHAAEQAAKENPNAH